METLETEVKETLELFSRYGITDKKTIENIGELIEKAVRDKNTDVAEAITYLLVARNLKVPNFKEIATLFYDNDYMDYLLDFNINYLLKSKIITQTNHS